MSFYFYFLVNCYLLALIELFLISEKGNYHYHVMFGVSKIFI